MYSTCDSKVHSDFLSFLTACKHCISVSPLFQRFLTSLTWSHTATCPVSVIQHPGQLANAVSRELPFVSHSLRHALHFLPTLPTSHALQPLLKRRPGEPHKSKAMMTDWHGPKCLLLRLPSCHLVSLFRLTRAPNHHVLFGVKKINQLHRKIPWKMLFSSFAYKFCFFLFLSCKSISDLQNVHSVQKTMYLITYRTWYNWSLT